MHVRLVLASRQVSARGGSETYLLTVARELVRLGHEVTIHADSGEADLDADDGIARSHGAVGLPAEVDVIIAQDAIVSFALAERFPGTPQIFVVHSSVHDLQLPPQLSGLVGVVVVMNDRVHARMRALASPPDRIVRLTQPVAFDPFSHPRPLPERATRLLSLGNRLDGDRRAALVAACEQNGAEFVQIGAHAGTVIEPSAAIADADIVVGYGRCIVEAMMAGRAAFVFDHQGGDGWITAENYADAEADGFVGRVGEPLSVDDLATALAGYRASMGSTNRDLALRHHDAAEHARQLVDLARSLTVGSEQVTHAAEFARLTRVGWHWEAAAIQRQQAIEERDRELVEVRELRNLPAVLEETQAKLESATRRGDVSDTRLQELETEVASLRSEREQLEASGSYRLARWIARMMPTRHRR